MAEDGIAAGGVMDVNTALQEVLKTALIHDGLASGIREAAKALDKRQAHLCVLASSYDEPMYVKLVEALCAEHQINLIKVDDNKKLGEWVGLCKTDREGKPHEVVGWSCVVVKDYGKESQAKDVIKEYFKCKKWWNKTLSSWGKKKKSSYTMIKFGLFQECKDSLVHANQSMWYTMLKNWKIKIIW